MKNLKINAILVGITVSLVACSFVSLNPQAKDIVVSANQNSMSNCKLLGNTNVSVWKKAGSFQSQETIESQLNILARNEAAQMGGNTVTQDSNITDGQRSFKVYTCPVQKSGQ